MSKKICFVVQRYGQEVNGGAELHCKQLAEKMVSRYSEVHVLTTKAIDYVTWADYYSQKNEVINGVHVHRFGVKSKRKMDAFAELVEMFYAGRIKAEDEKNWIEKQGPYVPDLLEYLVDNKDNYDAFIFFTYLYYTTVFGLPLVSDKAVLIPTAHDEPFLRMGVFKDVFCKPRGILFNTEEERILIHNKFQNDDIPNELGGVGVDLPDHIDADRFKKKKGIKRYVVYVGRIDRNKSCDVLFTYFMEYKKRNKNDLKLVLMGKPIMDIPDHPDIINLGFVEEEDKFDGIAGAEILILPSEFESLSMVVLEAMSVRTSVMVYGKCDVLRGHCIKSNGALYYNNYFEFEGEINYLLSHSEERQQMLENAYQYVQNHYQWDIIVDRLSGLIEQI